MKPLHLAAAVAALVCASSASQAYTLVGQTISGSFSTNQTPGVITQFTSPIVAPGDFSGVMQDVFSQVWDINVDVLANSITVGFTSANPDANVASSPLIDIDLSGFTGLPPLVLTGYTCVPPGSFACGAFGPGPSVARLTSTPTTFDVGFDIMREGETYTFGFGGVPEPATWGLMLIGFGLVGGVARARRQVPATA